MQITNREKIGRALEELRQGLLPIINSRLTVREKADWHASSPYPRNSNEFDVTDCLKVLDRFWIVKFNSPKLGRAARAWVNELIDVRHTLTTAHQSSCEDASIEDTQRALDTAERLLSGFGSPQAEKVHALKLELRDKSESKTTLAPEHPPIRLPAEPRPGNKCKSPTESLHVRDLFGGLAIGATSQGVSSLLFGECENRPGPMSSAAERQLREYASGKRTSFDLPWDIKGTPFQRQVWQALSEIPYGQTRSYADIARAIKNPRAAQAVGGANSRNPLFIIIPCHRVISADGSLGGWGPGEHKKQELLELEKRYSR